MPALKINDAQSLASEGRSRSRVTGSSLGKLHNAAVIGAPMADGLTHPEEKLLVHGAPGKVSYSCYATHESLMESESALSRHHQIPGRRLTRPGDRAPSPSVPY